MKRNGLISKVRFAKVKQSAKDISGHYLPQWLYEKPIEIVGETDMTYELRINTNQAYIFEVQKKHCTLLDKE